MAEHFDLIIIGSGPGGLAAALYAARGRMKTLVLEKGQNGGQAAITHLIENYPGSIEDPTGPKLTHRMLEQAKNFGAEIRKEEVVDVDFTGKEKMYEDFKNRWNKEDSPWKFNDNDYSAILNF